jgi:O-antigen/teichoic acid export membrane protein
MAPRLPAQPTDQRYASACRVPDRKASLAPSIQVHHRGRSASHSFRPWLPPWVRMHANRSLIGVWVLRIASAKPILTMADQAIVSGASFLTTVLVGRFAGTSELGLYFLGASILIAVLCVQESLITQPYAIKRHDDIATPAQHTGSALILSLMFSAMSALAILAAAAVSSLSGNPELTALTWALSAVAPFVLVREFGRQIEFGHLNPAKTVIMDFAAAATQLAALAGLGWNGHMSAVTALAASGAGCAVAGAIWFLLFRRAFAFDKSRMPAATKQSLNLGKWFLANQMVLVAQANISIWMLAAIAGTANTGIFAACMSVVSLSNPIVLGLSNILLAKSAASFRDGGSTQLRRDTRKDALMLGGVMALFAVFVSFFGDDVMRLVYPAQHYQNYNLVLAILATWQLATAVSIPPFYALSGMEHVRLNFWIGLTAAVVTTVLLWVLIAKWGTLGAAYALLTGAVMRCFARWAAFLTLSAQQRTG